jgi:hypothetical protein
MAASAKAAKIFFIIKNSYGGHVLTATIGEKIFPFNEWSRYFA